MATNNQQTFVLKKNVNTCSHCNQQNLPAPIAFAKLCHLTGEYVCDGCYLLGLEALMDMEDARG